MKFSGAQGSRHGHGRESSAKKRSTRFGGPHDLSPGQHSRRLDGIIPIRLKPGCCTCDGEAAESVPATDRHCGAPQLAGAPRCGARSVNADTGAISCGVRQAVIFVQTGSRRRSKRFSLRPTPEIARESCPAVQRASYRSSHRQRGGGGPNPLASFPGDNVAEKFSGRRCNGRIFTSIWT